MLDRKLQQRLVGIFVLATFILLIAPVLFDAQGRLPEKITNIPPQPKQPDLSHIPVIEPSPLVVKNDLVVESSVGVKQGLVQDANTELQQEPVSVSQTETPVAAVPSRLWGVQVASFRDVAKANAFQAGLRDANFKTYTRGKVLSDGSFFTQVFVGPVESKNQAEGLKAQVKQQFNEQGLVVRFKE